MVAEESTMAEASSFPMRPLSSQDNPARGRRQLVGGRVHVPGAGRRRALLGGQDFSKTLHWSENNSAFEMMKQSHFSMKAPPLQQHLTQFHATTVPMEMIWFVQTSELERLSVTDKFWNRITKHVCVWRGFYCRDYGLSTADSTQSCVWRTTLGKRERCQQPCLFHLGVTNPTEYRAVCKRITAIPGRSREELIASYIAWRREQLELQRGGSESGSDLGSGLLVGPQPTMQAPEEEESEGVRREAELPWAVRAHCAFGLRAKHARPLPCGDGLKAPVGRAPWKPKALKLPGEPSAAIAMPRPWPERRDPRRARSQLPSRGGREVASAPVALQARPPSGARGEERPWLAPPKRYVLARTPR